MYIQEDRKAIVPVVLFIYLKGLHSTLQMGWGGEFFSKQLTKAVNSDQTMQQKIKARLEHFTPLF